MLNQYETVFIATPILSEEQVKEAVNKFTKIITDNGGEILHTENWGLRKLEYPILNKKTGFYNMIEFKAPGDFINKLEVEFRRDEKIVRFLTFRMDKYAIAYSEKRRNKLSEAKKEKKDEQVKKEEK